MAGDWLKFDKTTPDKPEVFEIANALNIDPDAVVGKLLRVWSWFDDHTEDGNAPVTVSALLDRITGITGFVSAVIDVGWLEREGDVMSVSNFTRHNGKTAKNRATTALRVANHRAGKVKSNANVTQEPLPEPLPEKRREEKSIVPTLTGVGEAEGCPGEPLPTPGFPEKKTVLDYATKQGWPIESASKFWLHNDQAKSNNDRSIGPNWHWWSALEMWVQNDFRMGAGRTGSNGRKKPTITDIESADEWDDSQMNPKSNS